MSICCPVCGKTFDDNLDACPYCGHIINREKYDTIGNYEPSSATFYTTEYTAIADTFKDDIDGKKKKEELLKKGIIDDNWLLSFVNWGILDSKESEYSLTLLGKKGYFENLKWRKKNKPIGENHNGK